MKEVKEKNVKVEEKVENKETKKLSKGTIISVTIACIVVIVVIALAITYCVLQRKDNDKKDIIKAELSEQLKLENKTVEYGDKLDIEGLDLKETKLLLGDKEITEYTFNNVGDVIFTQKAENIFKTFLNKEEVLSKCKDIIYTVEDTKAPVIEGVEDKTITEGEEIDIRSGISAKDEVDGDLEFVTEGEVDTNTVGEYKITVKASDNHGLETVKEFTVYVNAKPVVKTYSTSSGNRSSGSSYSGSSSSNSGSSNSGSSLAGTTWQSEGANKNERKYFNGGANYYYNGGSNKFTGDAAKELHNMNQGW